MKKFIKIFGVVIFVYCCLGIFNIAKAEHETETTPDNPLYNTPGIIKKIVPVYCGETALMFNFADKTFNQEPYMVGKVIHSKTKEILGVVTVLRNRDHITDMSVLMTLLNTGETCVLAYGQEIDYGIVKEESKYNGVFLSNF